MADQKITQLTALASAASTDVLPIVDVANTETKKITKADLLNGLQAELVSGTNIKTINSTSLLGSGDISLTTSAAGTSGQIQFNDSSAFGADSNLFWDNTNKRLGVGTSSPATALEVAGSGQFGGSAFVGQVNTGSSIGYYIKNAGVLKWGIRNDAGFESNGFNISNASSAVLMEISQGGNVGVGTLGAVAPSAKLHIKGSGSTSATTSLLVQNSSGTNLFSVRDDGLKSIGSGGIQFAYSSAGLGIGAVSTGLTSATPRIFSSGNDYLYLESGNSSNAIVVASGGSNHRVGINNGTPDLSAQLDVASTTRGFLPPRMTTTQKNAISSPASGLIIYDTDTNKLCCYNGTSWNDLF